MQRKHFEKSFKKKIISFSTASLSVGFFFVVPMIKRMVRDSLIAYHELIGYTSLIRHYGGILYNKYGYDCDGYDRQGYDVDAYTQEEVESIGFIRIEWNSKSDVDRVGYIDDVYYKLVGPFNLD